MQCKPGVVHLWSVNAPASPWSGSRSLPLETQKNSSALSALNPVSGISYIRGKDLLVLALHDGSFHAIHNFSSSPSWVPSEGNEKLTSHNLSQIARAIFVTTEQNEVNSRDVNRITGLASYDTSSSFLWIQEYAPIIPECPTYFIIYFRSSSPSDFSYKHDAKNNSMLIGAKMWEENNEDAVLLDELAAVLHTSRAGEYDLIP